MNGAESLVKTLLASGVSTCFANPGTSEMHFVSALDRIAGMRCVLGLHETVVTGCADGYGRIADQPAVTLLHCGAGLGNGIANLHNARRARTPIVNVVGDHATYHAVFDTPLTSDVEGIARPISDWVRTSRTAAAVGADAAAAIQAARTAPGRIATLVLPADAAWSAGGEVAAALAVPERPTVSEDRLQAVAGSIRGRSGVLFLLADRALREDGLALAHRIAAATGASLCTTTAVSRMARGRGRPQIPRLPYGMEQARAFLADKRQIVLVGARPPAAFFGYPDKRSELWDPAAELLVLTRPEQDPIDALARLADALGAPEAAAPAELAPTTATPDGAFSSLKFGQLLARRLPEQAIVAEDAVTSGRELFAPTFAAAPHDWLQITGGAIGLGLPMATGAAVAAPRRKVVCLQADGSGMYSLQALWTQARERLNVLTVVFSNRRYRILQGELQAVGAAAGPTTDALFSLGDPALDWVRLAEGMGVEAARASNFEELDRLLLGLMPKAGPALIEFVID